MYMWPPDPSKPPYIAKVTKIIKVNEGSNVNVRIQRFYWLKEVIGCQKLIHGAKEVYCHDVQCAATIEGKCKVQTFKSYTKVDNIGNANVRCLTIPTTLWFSAVAAMIADDCVYMRSSDPSKPSYIAKVKEIVMESGGSDVKVHVQWYYRPEEVKGGRKRFHGTKELFLSTDHFDVQWPQTIEGKCKVHTFKRYRELDTIDDDDFYSRFQYCRSTGRFNPDKVAVYCKCEMPYNPDDFMIECDGCEDWFHPGCINMTEEAALRLANYFCETCSDEQRMLKSAPAMPRHEVAKVETKRRRRR